MAESVLVGIDVGTSSVKAGAFTPDGRFLGLGRAPCRPDTPRPGWAELAAETVRTAFAAAVADLFRTSGVRPGDVAGVGLSVQFPALVPMDRSGNALMPAILYCDRRSGKEAADLLECVGGAQAFADLTGNRLAPGTCSVTSLAWVREHCPGVYAEAACFGHLSTLVLHWLTGTRGVCARPLRFLRSAYRPFVQATRRRGG
jgi:xylulokinase